MDYPQQHIKPYNEDGKKTEQVERMFDNIAHAYDKLNHTLSLGIDRSWRRKAIAWLRPFRPQHIMDVIHESGCHLALFAVLPINDLALFLYSLANFIRLQELPNVTHHPSAAF